MTVPQLSDQAVITGLAELSGSEPGQILAELNERVQVSESDFVSALRFLA